MYINFKYAVQKGITAGEILILQMCKQNKFEDTSENLEKLCTSDEKHLKKFEEKGFIFYVRGKKGDTIWKNARLSKKGDELLENITDSFGVEEEDEIVFDWLKKKYLSLGKEIGSEKKCKTLIAWFRKETGINKNNLVTLCKEFVMDEERMEYSKVLQYVFWKSENVFQTKPSLESSKLWGYYSKNKEKFNFQ